MTHNIDGNGIQGAIFRGILAANKTVIAQESAIDAIGTELRALADACEAMSQDATCRSVIRKQLAPEDARLLRELADGLARNFEQRTELFDTYRK